MKDVSFVLDAVDEMDPWLEHTRSPAAVARAYRDYVLAKCHSAGLKLTDDEYQLIQVWFGASQWSSATPPQNHGHGQPGGMQQDMPSAQRHPLPAVDARGYARDGSLPPPDNRSDIPLPPDFGFDRELESEQQGQKAANQRFSFLKH
jgi:hypothetical protein